MKKIKEAKLKYYYNITLLEIGCGKYEIKTKYSTQNGMKDSISYTIYGANEARKKYKELVDVKFNKGYKLERKIEQEEKVENKICIISI